MSLYTFYSVVAMIYLVIGIGSLWGVLARRKLISIIKYKKEPTYRFLLSLSTGEIKLVLKLKDYLNGMWLFYEALRNTSNKDHEFFVDVLKMEKSFKNFKKRTKKYALYILVVFGFSFFIIILLIWNYHLEFQSV